MGEHRYFVWLNMNGMHSRKPARQDAVPAQELNRGAACPALFVPVEKR